ncbi:MAG: hypothetical protein JWS10_3503 [Cypionkella sp.]|nr:hypothetical protein [Cypionkella sp.]
MMCKAAVVQITRGAERSWKVLFPLVMVWLIQMLLVTFAPNRVGGWYLMGYLSFPLLLPIILWLCWLNGYPED